uniref:Uncharacterized protein n=1 Tax=Heterorhabditis bacteriophora TaxID=37862 RepID=A0A1I7WDU8_HETBA
MENDKRYNNIEENQNEKDDDGERYERSSVYEFLFKRMKQDAEKSTKKRPVPNVYMIPGPQEPLPGRSYIGDYWPVFPFQNQYSGGLDLDPAESRVNQIYFLIHDTTTKFGYLNYPVNMLDLEKQDFVRLMSEPSMHWNQRKNEIERSAPKIR